MRCRAARGPRGADRAGPGRVWPAWQRRSRAVGLARPGPALGRQEGGPGGAGRTYRPRASAAGSLLTRAVWACGARIARACVLRVRLRPASACVPVHACMLVRVCARGLCQGVRRARFRARACIWLSESGRVRVGPAAAAGRRTAAGHAPRAGAGHSFRVHPAFKLSQSQSPPSRRVLPSKSDSGSESGSAPPGRGRIPDSHSGARTDWQPERQPPAGAESAARAARIIRRTVTGVGSARATLKLGPGLRAFHDREQLPGPDSRSGFRRQCGPGAESSPGPDDHASGGEQCWQVVPARAGMIRVVKASIASIGKESSLYYGP
jgi:hypothetical protein